MANELADFDSLTSMLDSLVDSFQDWKEEPKKNKAAVLPVVHLDEKEDPKEHKEVEGEGEAEGGSEVDPEGLPNYEDFLSSEQEGEHEEVAAPSVQSYPAPPPVYAQAQTIAPEQVPPAHSALEDSTVLQQKKEEAKDKNTVKPVKKQPPRMDAALPLPPSLPSVAAPSVDEKPKRVRPVEMPSPIANPSDTLPPPLPSVDAPAESEIKRSYRPPKVQIDDIPPPMQTNNRRTRAGTMDQSAKKAKIEEILTKRPVLVKTTTQNPSSQTMRSPSKPSQKSDVWKEYTSKTTGRKYYYNTLTKKTTWETPQASHPSPQTQRTIRSQSVAHQHFLSEGNLDPQREQRQLRQPTEGMIQSILTTRLVDESTKKFIVTEDFTVQDVLYVFSEKLDLWQTEYFNICVTSPDGNDRWLHPQKTLADERITNQSQLYLKIKHFKRPKKLIDPVAIHLFFLQVKDNIINGEWGCTEKIALKLASYQLLNLYGPFMAEKHQVGFFDSDTIRTFIPKSIADTSPIDYLQRRIFAIYSRLSNMRKTEAEVKYIDLAQTLPLYGVTLFDVSESNQLRRFGIAEDGFLISKKDQKDTFDFYGFEEISGWNQTGAGIQIRISNPEKKPVFDVNSTSGTQMSELLSEYYCLLSLQKPEIPPVDIPVEPSCLPEYRLYQLPEAREVSDPNFSRLEYFKAIYLEECTAASSKPLMELLEQVDSCLDEGTDMEAMDLSGCHLDCQQLDLVATSTAKVFHYKAKIGQKFHENMNLHTIDLSSNPIGPEGSQGLGKLLCAPFPLRSLHLRKIGLGVKGSKAISIHLENNKSLQELSVDENDLTNRGAVTIIEAIRANKNCIKVSLSKNGIDEKITDAIGKLLQSNPEFSGLSLSNNKLGDSGVNNLITEFRRAHKKSMEQLELSDVGMSSTSKNLMIWLSQNSQMKDLVIAGNNLTDKAADELAKVLLDSVSRLKKLDIKLCNIGTKSMFKLSGSIGSNRRLEELLLSGNLIKKKAGAALSDSLDVNRSLTHISLRNCSLAKPTLVLLVKSIRKHPSIKVLDLAMNDSSSSDASGAIGEMLTFTTALEDVNLAQNQLTKEGIISLCAGISKNSTLKRIHLDANRFGKHVVKLAQAVNDHKKLEILTLKNIEVSKKDMMDFFNTLATSCGLKLINLERNELDKQVYSSRLKQYPHTKVKFE